LECVLLYSVNEFQTTIKTTDLTMSFFDNNHLNAMSRRQILKAGLLTSVAVITPISAWALNNFSNKPVRFLSLFNIHTGEKLTSIIYWENGQYCIEQMAKINYVLRDHRTEEVHPIDVSTLDLLSAISIKLNNKNPFEIISGYRSPQTNSALHRQNKGVVKNSYHIKGMAVDIRVPGVPLKTLRRAALELQAGGVGYYPQSGFVHVDSGNTRVW
jgi:uncharacterized protein YcbK (DUF882 family)